VPETKSERLKKKIALWRRLSQWDGENVEEKWKWPGSYSFIWRKWRNSMRRSICLPERLQPITLWKKSCCEELQVRRSTLRESSMKRRESTRNEEMKSKWLFIPYCIWLWSLISQLAWLLKWLTTDSLSCYIWAVSQWLSREKCPLCSIRLMEMHMIACCHFQYSNENVIKAIFIRAL